MKGWIISKLPDIDSPPSRKRVVRLAMPFEYLSIAVTLAQGLLLIPLYLHYIGAHTYGLWLASGGFLVLLGFANLGIGPMMNQRIATAYGERQFTRVSSFFVNGFILYIGLSIVFLLLGSMVAYAIPVIFNIRGDEAKLLQLCFLIAVVATAFNLLNEGLRGFASAMLRPIFPVLSLLICRLLGLILTVFLLFHAAGLWAIPMGMFLTAVTVFISNLLFAACLHYQLGWHIRIQADVLKEYLHASPALISGKLGNVLTQDVEPLLITLFLTPEIAAAYVVVMRAGSMVSMAAHVIIGVLTQPFAHLFGEGNRDKIRKMSKNILMTLSFAGFIGFSTYIVLDRQFVSLWVGEQYLIGGCALIPLIGLSLFANMFRNFFADFLIASGDILFPSWSLAVEAVVRLCFILLLLSAFGLVGIPLATFISCALCSLVLGRRFFSKMGMTFNAQSIARTTAICTLFVGLAVYGGMQLPMVISWIGFTGYCITVTLVFTLVFITIYRNESMLIWRNLWKQSEKLDG